MLTTLSEKVRPDHCAILLADVQKDFCGRAAWAKGKHEG